MCKRMRREKIKEINGSCREMHIRSMQIYRSHINRLQRQVEEDEK